MADIMNAGRRGGVALEKALTARLEDLLAGVAWLKHGPVQRFPAIQDGGFDLRVDLKPPRGGKVALWVQCKADPRPALFPSVFVAGEADPLPIPVLGAPFITPRMAEVCQREGWGWFDLAGNCRLDVPGVLHMHVSGNPPVQRRPRPTANLGTPEAGRVIRALLHPEHTGMRWTQRYLAEHFGERGLPIPAPSLGLVNKVVRYLRDEAFIEELPEGGFRVRDALKLLLAWRDAYRFDRHVRGEYFTLLQGGKLRDALAGFGAHVGGFAAYAAFSAADFQAPNVRQPKTWLYIQEEERALFEEQLQAKRVESGGNIVLLIPEDAGVFYLGDAGTADELRLACTCVVQTYVDLWACGGRGKEAAEAVLEQRIKPAWTDARPA